MLLFTLFRAPPNGRCVKISLRWQWYLSGRSTSVHWSKNCCGFASGWKPIHSPRITQAFMSVDGRAVSVLDVIYYSCCCCCSCNAGRVYSDSATGSVRCVLSAPSIFTARRYAMSDYAMVALCLCVCLSQVAAKPITVVRKAARVYVPIIGGVVWTFYRVLCKNGWTDRQQSLKPTQIHAKCVVMEL